MPTSTARESLPSALARAALAVAVGLAAYGVSWLLVPGVPEAHGFGEQWQMMAAQPFALVGQLPHRILAPLLAWATGFGGPGGWVPFTRGLTVLMLAVVFLYGRSERARSIDAALVALAVALIAPVQMYKLHWVGYADPLCYTLFFLSAMAVRSTPTFWLLFLANLFNHELAAFLLPWLWFLRRRAGAAWRADVVWAAATLAVYAAYYYYVKAHAAQQLFSDAYFREHPLFPGGTVVVWGLAIVHYTVAFGPVLAVLAWHQARPEFGRERWGTWLVLAGIAAIFCIAFDWNRHTNLIAMPLALASLRFLQAGHRLVYVGLLAVTVALTTWIPPWPPVSWPTSLFFDPAFAAGVVVPTKETGGLGFYFGPLSAALQGWLPAVGKELAVICGILLAILATGVAYAKLGPDRRRSLPS